jgi:vancomycin permeability regulator SanA
LRRKLAGLVLGLILLVLAGFLITYMIIDQQSSRDEAQPADVILVLGSAVWPNELPSPSLRARTERAIELYQQGYAAHLILSGGLGRWPPEEAEVMRRLAEAEGVPQQAMILDLEAHSTWESIARAEEILDQEGWETAIVVSDPFHMTRALLMARDAGIVGYGAPALDSPTYTIPSRRVFYTSREVLALWWYLVQRLWHPG